MVTRAKLNGTNLTKLLYANNLPSSLAPLSSASSKVKRNSLLLLIKSWSNRGYARCARGCKAAKFSATSGGSARRARRALVRATRK